MMLDFHKIRRLPPYVFEQVNVTKAGLRANGADVIDLGCLPGTPFPQLEEAVQALVADSARFAAQGTRVLAVRCRSRS